MSNFFGDIAKRFGLIKQAVGLYSETERTKAQTAVTQQRLTALQTPKIEPITTPKAGGFFGDIGQKYGLKLPQLITEKQAYPQGYSAPEFLESAKKAGEELRVKLGEPIVKYAREAGREFIMPGVKQAIPESIYKKTVGTLPIEEPKGKIAPAVGGVAGFMVAFTTVSGVWGTLMAKSRLGNALIRIAPKVAKGVQTTISGLTFDQLKAPVETTLQERQKIFNTSLPRWLGFGVAGGFAPKEVYGWLPAVFTGQFASSKLEGKDNQEAFKDSLILSAIMGAFKILELPKDPQTILKEQAAEKLGIKPNATLDQAKSAWKNQNKSLGQKALQGDVSANETLKGVNSAYDIFKGTPSQIQASYLQEIKNYYNWLRSPEGKNMALTILNEVPPIGLTIKDVSPKPEEKKVGGLREKIGQEYLGGYRNYVAELKKTGSEPVPFEQWAKFHSIQEVRKVGVPEVPKTDIENIKEKILSFKPENQNDRELLTKAGSEIATYNQIGSFSKTGNSTIAKFLKRFDEISKIQPIIPKELQPLAQEALKYKSAEEFVKDIHQRFGGDAQILNTNKLDIYETKIDRNLVNKFKERIKSGDDSVFLHTEWKNKVPAIIVEESKGKYKVVDGNHKLLAAKELGIKSVPVGIKGYGNTSLALKVSYKKGDILTDFYQAVKGEVKQGIPGVKGLEAVGLKPEPSPLIVRREVTLLKDRIRNIARGAREGTINTREQIKATQTELIDIIEKSNLELNDKAKFLRTVKNIQTTEQLQKALPEIENRIVKLEQAELSRGIQARIDRELKYVKPIKVGQKLIAKYDYQTNKFLEGLRANNKLNQEQAQANLDKIPTEGLSELAKIEARFLSLKSNGAKASVLLHEQVLADLRNLKEVGEIAKDEADFIKRIEKREKVDEVLKGVNQQKRVLRKLGDVYISSIANLYSTINTIAGKGIADKYDYGMYQTNSQYDFSEQVDKSTNKAKEIYGLKDNRQLTNLFVGELAPTNWTITDTTGLKTEINKFNLIDIYNATKNTLVKERYNNAFGEEQVNALLQNLTEEDVKLADYLMDEVQEYKDILNQRSIETTGRDNGEVENYWPSTSEYEVDFFDDVRTQGETPSAMKVRSKSSKVFPRIDNAWLKYQKHIAQGEHIRTISKKYEELKNLFSDRILKNTIKNKFGDESYTALIDHIETFSLNKRVQMLDIFSGVYNTALNNWVKAKIGSPTVLARQLISSIYSIENVGAKNFFKYQAEVIKNPTEAFKYMWDNIPFLRIRFKQGYSEALQDAIKGTSNLKVGMDSITKYVTLGTRGGDITAILINGYPIIKTEMAKHGNMQKAIEEFQKFTEKTQQSGTRANLSRLQRERNAFARTFFRFKNTTNQLLRLQTDATVQFLNKQISAQAFATKTVLYSIYTPMMYVLIGYLIRQGWKRLFGADDEDDEEEGKSLPGDVLAQIVIQPYQALPFVDMAAENAYAEIRKRLTGKGYYFGGGLFSYPLLSDIETAWSKLRKKEPTAADLLRVFSLLQEPATGIPTETILRYYGYTQKEKVDIVKKYRDKYLKKQEGEDIRKKYRDKYLK